MNVGDRVFFESDSSELSQQAVGTLERQAQWLRAYPQYSFLIEGHADERGTREYNIALGARRAQAVRDYLSLARRAGPAHAHDLFRQGTAGGCLQRHLVLVAEPALGHGSQREFLSGGYGGNGDNRRPRAPVVFWPPPDARRRYRRNSCEPTITVQSDTSPGVESATVVSRLEPAIKAIRAKLPEGYAIEVGGTVEESEKGQASVTAVVPLMLLAILTILMVQLQSFQRLILVISVAPLGLIGIVAAMLPTGTPMGFIATLGVIALIGMIIRNSVILIDQIETNIAGGHDPWTAIVEATMHRLRPILLTAAAAILGMLPIARDVFWGPMAYAVIGGLAVATVLTLIFLPALYAAWFRVRAPAPREPRRPQPRPGPEPEVRAPGPRVNFQSGHQSDSRKYPLCRGQIVIIST